MKNVFAVMDDETRFWIAHDVADSKQKHDARHLFFQSYKKAGKVCHNFVRPHPALGGKTPADLAGIKVKGENKWLTLIQNAIKSCSE